MKSFPEFPARAEVRTIDGNTFQGTADEVVAAMRSLSMTPEKSIRKFREAVAERATLWIKQPIRSSKSDLFLLDMAASGLLTITATATEGN